MHDRPTRRISKLLGRLDELAELTHALRAVREKRTAQIVTVLGPPGIGKTRLVRHWAEGQPDVRVFRGAAREGGPVHDVFARLLRFRFDLTESLDAESAKTRLRMQVAEVLDDRKVGDVCFFLGQLLGLEFRDSPLIQAVRDDALQMTALRRAVLRRFFEADAPSILVFDDLTHAHDESLDLLAHLLDTLRAPVLIVCIGRPELVARRDGWTKHGGTRHGTIELGPLFENDAALMMEELLVPCAEDDAVEDLIDSACMHAGGNPALLERMVRIFHDMGVLEVRHGLPARGEETPRLPDGAEWAIHPERLDAVKLPLSVDDAIQARIGALSPAERALLEHAAMLGSVFWLGGLVAMARLDVNGPDLWMPQAVSDVAEIEATLKELVERDYILSLPDGTFPDEVELVFKHNLERETLFNLVPRTAAKRLHKVIADWLSFKPHVRTHEEYLGMLAHHQEEAGLVVQAAATYLDAAHLARERYSNTKAAEYYAKGLGLLRDGAEGSTEQQLRALHHFGDVLQVLGRTDEALDCFNEMLARSFRLDLRAKGGAAHGRVGRLYRDRGRLDEAQAHLDCALALFENAGDDRGVASTTDDLGKLQWLRGDYPEALASTQRALVIRRKLGDPRSIALSLNNLGLVYQDSGRFKLALDAFEQALRIRREIGDLIGVAISLSNLGTVAQDQADDKRALHLFLEAHAVAKETGSRGQITLILTNLGDTYSRLGDPTKAIHYLKQAEEIADELGDKMGLAEAARGLGKAYLMLRDATRARAYSVEAVEVFRETLSLVPLGVALRSLGEVEAAFSAGGEGAVNARANVHEAIMIFEEIGNDIELARSWQTYADLLRSTGESADSTEADQLSAKAKAIFDRT